MGSFMPFIRALPRLAPLTWVLFILGLPALANPVHKIVDTSMPIPGGTGETFRSFDPPAVERMMVGPGGGTIRVTFRATGPDGYEGIFKATNGDLVGTMYGELRLETIADTRTP